MSIQLERSRTKSIEQMKEVNRQSYIQKMTDYYEVVDHGNVEVPPEQKAIIDFENKKAAGYFDELNQPIKMDFEIDPQIIQIQKEIEKVIKERTAA